jgi:hypothetical protein
MKIEVCGGETVTITPIGHYNIL